MFHSVVAAAALYPPLPFWGGGVVFSICTLRVSSSKLHLTVGFERVYPKEITGNNAGPVTESFGKLARSFLAASLFFAFPHLNRYVSGV